MKSLFVFLMGSPPRLPGGRGAGSEAQHPDHRRRRHGLLRHRLLRRRDPDAEPGRLAEHGLRFTQFLQHLALLGVARVHPHRSTIRRPSAATCCRKWTAANMACSARSAARTASARAGRKCCPPISSRSAIVPIIPASGTWTATACPPGSTTPIRSKTTTASSVRRAISRTM